MSIAGGVSNDWKPEELALRKTEVGAAADNARTQRKAKNVQIFVSLLSTIAVAVAAVAAYEGFMALKITSQNNADQATQNQLTTAINALGSSDPAERIAGLVLLRRNASHQIDPRPAARRDRQSAYDSYVAALQVFGSYIHNYGLDSVKHAGGSFGLGYGTPPGSNSGIDVVYAADEIRILLGQRSAVRAVSAGDAPSIDLSGDELYGQSWPQIDFSWLHRKYLVGIDLRGANLEYSHWGTGASLQAAHFQCANLEHADFHGADLRNADFRGADVQGADFTGAKLWKAQTGPVYGDAKGLPAGKALQSWKGPAKPRCIAAYQDSPPGRRP
jgi:hypothetical protein